MDTNELKNLYDEAKEAYYNGNPIMGDAEFDELEAELGLENNGYVGEHHSANFTIKHPIIMGSLSKVQIKRGDNGDIDWNGFATQITKYLTHTSTANQFEITPKYDGCSFELQFDDQGKFMGTSTRGDGNWGKDISPWFVKELQNGHWSGLQQFIHNTLKPNQKLIIRGEILIDKFVFADKYSSKFTNPRSFVAGLIGQDYTDTKTQQEMRADLTFICYDYRIIESNTNYKHINYTQYNNIGKTPELIVTSEDALTGEYLKAVYEKFEKFRTTNTFTLDGLVFKPYTTTRECDNVERPKDCVAVKFLPEIKTTTIIDCEWSLGKTGELFPVAIFDTIRLDNKAVSRASLHNFGFVLDNNIGIGTQVKISMAGDIIPFIYQIIEPNKKVADFVLPENADTDNFDGTHLMKIMSEDDIRKNRFLTSCRAINVEGIGPKIAEQLFEISNKYTNINDLFVDMNEQPEDCEMRINKKIGYGKAAENIIKAIQARIPKLTVKDIIVGCAFPVAGEHICTACADYFLTGDADFTGLNRAGYSWVLDKNSKEYHDVATYIHILGVSTTVKKQEPQGDVTYIIMTGSPKEFGFNTKKDFLAKHPEYKETTKWEQAQILFTDDLNSTSSKMKKAIKLGISIKLYE